MTPGVCWQIVWKIAAICVSKQSTAGSVESPMQFSTGLRTSVVCL